MEGGASQSRVDPRKEIVYFKNEIIDFLNEMKIICLRIDNLKHHKGEEEFDDLIDLLGDSTITLQEFLEDFVSESEEEDPDYEDGSSSGEI